MNGTVDLTTPHSFVETIPLKIGSTIRDHFEILNVQNNPVLCVLNDAPVLRKDWDIVVGENDRLQFVILPLGGTFKKIIGAVAMIALMVAAPMVAGPLAGVLGFSTTGVVANLIGAAIVIGGSMLINALLGPGTTPEAQEAAAASPTYTLSAQGNSARLFQPIPRLYGKHIIFPDFAAQPWSTYKGNDQFLYQLFCAGLGEYDIHQIRIEDSLLWDEDTGYSPSFNDVEVEIIPPGQPLTLFPSAIDTSEEVGGQELVAMDDTVNVVFAGNRITIQNLNEETAETLVNIRVGDQLTITGTAENNVTCLVVGISGDGEWVDTDTTFADETTSANISSVGWLGPFSAVASDRQTRSLLIDFVLPRGLFYANDEGGLTEFSVGVEVQARSIDSTGAPIGPWTTLESVTFADKTATPIRRTLEYSVTLARYEVRVRRTTNKEISTRHANEIQWAALRSAIPDDSVYPDVTLVAVKMRASNQLTQQSARRFNFIQTAKVPVWDGESWSAPQPTRSIAWAAADLLRNTDYGAGVPDSRIDLTGLLALDQTWAARGDTFDGIFDTRQTLWDALGNILRVGRSQPVLIAGMINFVRDQPAQIVRGVFTPRNIIRDSFETTYVLYDESSPDAVIVEFMDERTWQPNEVLCRVAGASEDNPARIKLFGCAKRDQAWREGVYQAAVNLYRRMFASFVTEMEGRMLIRGDTTLVSFDIPKWGTSSEALGWNPDTRVITLSEPANGDETLCGITDRRGQLWGTVDIEAIAEDGSSVTLDSVSLANLEAQKGEIPIYVGLSQEETRLLLGTAESYSRQFKVVTARPDGLERVRLGLTVDDSRVYDADTGPVPVEGTSEQVNSLPYAPSVGGVVLTQDPQSLSDPVTLRASWNAASGAQSYIAQSSSDGIIWRTVFQGEGTSCVFEESAGTIYFRVAAVGSLTGPWAYPDPNPVSYGEPSLTPSAPQFLTVDADTVAAAITANWTAAARATSYIVEIHSESAPGVFDVLEITKTTRATSALFTSSEIVSAGGPWTNLRVSVQPSNSHGVGPSAHYDVLDLTLPTPSSIVLVTAYDGQDINVQWSAVDYATSYLVEVYESDVKRGEFITTTNSIMITASSIVSMGGPWRSMEIRVTAKNASLSSGAPATLIVGDEAPPVPQNIVTSSPSTNVIDVSWDPVEVNDFKAYVLFASSAAGFVPSAANEVYRGSLTNASFSGFGSGTTAYMRLRAEDNYSKEEFNDSAEFSQVAS